ncbi:grainyhead-like protein 1 homolog isoform X1 [Clavelina lepadiformis]|uniref:grainyhead-like protein 1 homolog isoform X1 n=1 Tax=Clavelina lepadiformis TaxID=159417 RepID=UPI004042BA5A
MFQPVNVYSTLSNHSDDFRSRRDSTADPGYCSNNNSPDAAELGFEHDHHNLPSADSTMANTLNFDSTGELFLTFDKALNENATRSPLSGNNVPMSRRKSLNHEKSGSIFYQMENSAFTRRDTRRYGKSYAGFHLAESTGALRRDAGKLPNKINPSHVHLLDDEMFRSPQPDLDTSCDHRGGRNPVGTLTNGIPLSNNFNRASNVLVRPDPIRRLHSDSGINHVRQPSFLELDSSMDVTEFSNDYSNAVQREVDNKLHCKSNNFKPHLGDLGFMDPAMLTLTPDVDHTSEFQADDTLETFFDGAETEFVSPACSPERGLTPQKNVCDLPITSVVENATIGIPSSIGAVHSGSMDPRFSKTEDEAWRSYLENPVTAATTALMSIQGDEDSAAALDILYDYYKVPREKRVLAYQPGDIPQTRSSSSCQDGDSSGTGMLSDEVSILSPVSTVGSRAPSHVANQALGTPLKDTISDGVFSPTQLSQGVSGCNDDVTPLTTVKSESALHPETTAASSSDYLNIGRAPPNDLKINQPTSESLMSENKSTSPHKLSFGDYGHKYHLQSPSRVSSRRPSLSIRNHNSRESGNVFLSTVSTDSQQLGSPVCSLTNMFGHQLETLPPDYVGERFEYTMEAPKSLKQKEGEPTMSYINKGQFYCISLRECGGQVAKFKSTRFTSVVQIVFGDCKPEDEQIRHWKYWHARQHTAKQRIIDIADYKESCMISDIDEFAHNAIRFNWDAADVAKIFVSCNCLSTDFSAQKGIKGLPLLMQIDTYVDNRRGGVPDHRGVCQLKVFCDKGAERKIRDEERKAMRKRQKTSSKTGAVTHHRTLSPVDIKPIITTSGISHSPQPLVTCPNSLPSQKKQDTVIFKTVTDCSVPAVYFVPDIYANSNSMRNHVTLSPGGRLPSEPGFIGGMLTSSGGGELEQAFLSSQIEYFDPLHGGTKRSHSIISSEEGDYPPNKMSRLLEPDIPKKVLLYVRKEGNDVYDGVMLKEPSLNGLKEALQEKYDITAEKITKVLKKSKKGILVNVDDNIVRHYSNEDIFVIDIATEKTGDDVTYKVTLSVV